MSALSDIRMSRGLSLREAAKATGASAACLCRFENGRNVRVSDAVGAAICALYGTNPAEVRQPHQAVIARLRARLAATGGMQAISVPSTSPRVLRAAEALVAAGEAFCTYDVTYTVRHGPKRAEPRRVRKYVIVWAGPPVTPPPPEPDDLAHDDHVERWMETHDPDKLSSAAARYEATKPKWDMGER